MRAYLGSLLVVGLSVASARGAGRLDQLFDSWQEAQRNVKSLVVHFSLKRRDPRRGDVEKSEGVFRLLRTPKGEVFASYEDTTPNAKREKRRRVSYLLNDGKIYLLNHDQKIADRIEPADGDLRRFLARYFNPFVRLLNRKRAEGQCRLEVVKQDEWYTYLHVQPKQVDHSVWLPDTFREGRLTLMNEASKRVPKDMPIVLWYTDAVCEYTFEIKSWRWNGADGPRLDEFTKPEDRPGWEVPWPFR